MTLTHRDLEKDSADTAGDDIAISFEKNKSNRVSGCIESNQITSMENGSTNHQGNLNGIR